jgi:DNA mismatch repair protein MutS
MCRPKVGAAEECAKQWMRIQGMRHPCLRNALKLKGQGTELVANDITFDDTTQSLLITGPNMAGKSTLLRTVCLLVIMS